MKQIVFIITWLFGGLTVGWGQTEDDNKGSGNCLDFAGTDYVNVGNPTLWNNTFAGTNKQFSFEAWIRRDATGTSQAIIAKHDDAGGPCPEEHERAFIWYIDATSNQMIFLTRFNLDAPPNEDREYTASTALQVGEWYHVALTFDGTSSSNDGADRTKMYVNGVEETVTLSYSAGPLGSMQAGNAPLIFGAQVGTDPCTEATNFNGQIDEVRIWNAVRTQTQMRDNMSSKVDPSSEPNLIGYWNMNKGTGNTVYDLTSNGNNGTML